MRPRARDGYRTPLILLCVPVLAVLLLISALAQPARATTLEKLSIEQLSERATTIVLAETTSARGEIARSGTEGSVHAYVVTRVNVQVLKALKGAPGKNLSITVPGGTAEGVSASVDGMPRFAPGETSLLFLDGSGRVIGGFQGKLAVTDGVVEDLHQSLATIEARIGKAVSEDKAANKAPLARGFRGARDSFVAPQSVANQPTETQLQAVLPTTFADGFESGITSWTRLGSPTWGRASYRHSVGSYSAYCVASTYPAPAAYPALTDAVMIRGPFDLSGTTGGTFEFDLWLDSEFDYDGILFGISLDGSTYYGLDGYTGYTGGWQHIVVDLKAFPGLEAGTVDVTGKPNVWLVFEFLSDETDVGGPYEGAYVDQVSLNATSGVAPTISSISPGSASAGTGSRITISGTGFGTTPGAQGSVNFFFRSGQPTIPGHIVSWNTTSIVAEVPIGTVSDYDGSASSGPVTVTNGSGLTSSGHNFNVTFGYGQVRWPGSSVTFRVNPNSPDTSQEQSMVDAAAATWSDPAEFILTDAGICSTVDFYDDGYNDVFWSSSLLPTGVIAAALPGVSGSTITEFDICFNDQYGWGDGSSGTMDIQSIALHELGHWLELRDLYGSADSGKVMYGFGDYGEQKRTLAAADRDGIVWIYGSAVFPTVTDVSPSAGPSSGGTSVTIYGTGFLGATAVRFGGVDAASYYVNGASMITAVTPPRAQGVVDVRVTVGARTSNGQGTADDFAFGDPPAITGLSPAFGSEDGGNWVVITGTGFVGFPVTPAVWFGDSGLAESDYRVDSPTQITAKAPSHAPGIAEVVVHTGGGSTPTDSTANDYLYKVTPTISGLSPASGSTVGGASVTITGSGFTGVTGPSAVTFGGVNATDYVVNSPTQITATTPAHLAGTVNVIVIADGIPSRDSGAGNDFTYVVPIPTVSGLSPTNGPTPGGTSVTVTGTNLSGATAVKFGGTNATSFTVNSATQITATSPAHGAGTAEVVVTTPGGSSSTAGTANDFTYVAPTRYDQTNTNIVKNGVWLDYASTPSYLLSYGRSSTVGASATVWFTGTKIAWIGMKGSTPGIVDVYLDDVKKATLDLFASPAVYQAVLWTSDTLPSGTHHMDLVRNSASLSTEFIVLDALDIWGTIKAAPPTISSLSPASGSTTGGTSVTITGTGFTGLSGPSAVTFGGVNATSYTVNSATKITAIAPAHAAGKVRVQMTTAGGATPDTAADDFTYSVAPATTRTDVKKTTTVTTPGSTWSGTWSSYTSASAYGGSYMRSSTAGVYVFIAFKGTRLDWITMKGTTGGIADIYVDGSATKAATINLYVSSPVYQKNVWSTGTLADGYHTVRIVRSTSSATGRYLTIDAAEVAGTLVPTTRIEENATSAQSRFLWTPVFASWTTGTTTSASGGTYKYINTAGAKVTINFTGSSIALIAKVAPSYGNITVTLDGVAKTVSLYSAVTTYKKTVYSSGFLTPGNHTLVITRAGTKSSSSAGYTIDIDGIDLVGVLR